MTTQKLTYLGLQSFSWTAILIVCFLVACSLVFLLYRYERKLVSPAVGWTLVALRTLLLAFLLLMALQPTWSWKVRNEADQSILIAVDVSDSMGLVDQHASFREKQQWGVALGMIKRDTLNNGDDADANPDEAENGEIPEPAGTSLPVDINGEISPETWHGLNRFELARQLLTAPQIGLLERLKEISNSEVVLFSRTVKTSAPDQLTGSRENLSDGTAPATTSYLELLDYLAGRDDCSAAIFLTDGVDTSGERNWAPLNRMSGESKPIFSILTGTETEPIDLAIESIDLPDAVYKNDQPVIQVHLTTHGYNGRPLNVTLTNVATGTRITKEVFGNNGQIEVQLTPEMRDPGRQRFVVDVQPSSDQEGIVEQQLENNQQEIAINVVDDTSAVLLVDGEARWEFRFLDAAYERDERIRLQSVLFEQPYLGLLPNTFFQNSLRTARDAADPFENLDMVIWGDADPRAIDQRTWEALERFVGEQGGTLVISAGQRYLSSTMQNPILAKMLPLTNARVIEAADQKAAAHLQNSGFHLKLTPQGEQHPVMKMANDVGENANYWFKLPGHLRGFVGDPKPGASILAVPMGATISSSETRPAGVIITQNYGLGRVMWLGIDSTWRWRSRRGDRDHYRFWGQMSRWASEMRSSAGTDDVRLALTAGEIQVGESSIIRARWSRNMLRKVPGDFHPEIEVYPLHSEQLVPLMRFPLESVDTEPLLHESIVPDLPVGEYRLRLNIPDFPLGSEAIEAELFVTQRKNGETNRLTADRRLLDRFAATTKGAVFLPHEMDQLLARLSPESLVTETKADIPLWNHWLMFVMIMAILSVEWLVRKWHGLP